MNVFTLVLFKILQNPWRDFIFIPSCHEAVKSLCTDSFPFPLPKFSCRYARRRSIALRIIYAFGLSNASMYIFLASHAPAEALPVSHIARLILIYWVAFCKVDSPLLLFGLIFEEVDAHD